MLARATPLPERSKTFTIQVDTGRVHVFVAADDIHKKLVSSDNIREREVLSDFSAAARSRLTNRLS